MRVLNRTLTLFSVLVFMFMLVACKSTTETQTTTVEEQTTVQTLIYITLGETDLNMTVGEEIKLNCETNDTLGLTYTSSDTAILTVDETGNLKAISEGSVTVSVKSKLSDVEKQVTITVMKPKPKLMSIKGETVLNVGSSMTLEVFVSPENASTLVTWESSDPTILSVDEMGNVAGLKAGDVKVTARSKADTKVYSNIMIKVKDPILTISELTEPVTVDETIQLTVSISSQENLAVVWSSSDTSKATVDENGLLTTISSGVVTITVSLKDYPLVGNSITIQIFDSYDPSNILDLLVNKHNLQSNYRRFTAIGYTHTYSKEIYTSVSNYYFDTLKITQNFIPSGSGNRPGLMTPLSSSVTKYNEDNVFWVVVHDTGDTKSTATALAMSNYVTTPTTATSWHFTVDENDIYQHLPENERAFHAGDGSTLPALFDTGVQATDKNPTISITDGYYVLNGVKSKVQAPGNYPITPTGLYTQIGSNGNYYIMDTYYNSTYKVISNTGGNRNGIGIEMAINEGSDIYRTWQKTAKLVASLLVKYNLPLENFQYHRDFSGKNCPQTLFGSGLVTTFEDMVAIEYEIAKNFKGAQIIMTSLNPEYLDNTGRIIKFPAQPMTVSYRITVTLDGKTSSRELSTIIAPNN